MCNRKEYCNKGHLLEETRVVYSNGKSRCGKCVSVKNIAYARANKQSVKSSQLKVRYGITLEDYNKLLTEQGNVCYICKTTPNSLALSVDHNHITGNIRGLLCSNCNTLLGLAKDDVNILKAAIDYLENNGSIA